MDTAKIAKTICMAFSIAFILTLTSYWGLNFILQSQEIYYLGIATMGLLFPFFLSISYVMAVTAKRSLDKGIERLREQEELKFTKLTEQALSQKEPQR